MREWRQFPFPHYLFPQFHNLSPPVLRTMTPRRACASRDANSLAKLCLNVRMLECSNILTGCNERFMRENTLYRYRRDSTYTAASVPSDTICATRGTRKKGRYGRSRRSSPQSRSLRGCGVAAWELGRARFTLVRSAAVTPLARRQDCVFSQSCLDKAFGFILRLSYGYGAPLLITRPGPRPHFALNWIASRKG